MQKIIITGGSDGLGYELSKQLLEKGVQVVCLSRTKPKELNVVHVPADLTDQKELKNAVEIIHREHDQFDALINNAGRFVSEPLSALTYDATNSAIQLNLIAPMLLTSGLLDLIKKNEADIVNIASTLAYKTYAHQAAYGASKWGLRGFTENLRLELKDSRCRVMLCAPCGFQSRFVQKFTRQDAADLSAYVDPQGLARLIIQTLEAPKDIEVSEIIMNRKKK